MTPTDLAARILPDDPDALAAWLAGCPDILALAERDPDAAIARVADIVIANLEARAAIVVEIAGQRKAA